MADYHDVQRQPTYLQIDSQVVEPPPFRSSHLSRASRASRKSQASNQTWMYNTSSQQYTREPPAIVIPIARPEFPVPEYAQQAYPNGEPAIYDGMDGEEYMNIDPEGPDLETAMAMGDPHWSLESPASSIHKPKSRGGIGGFFQRLRRLPKTVFKGRSQKRKQLARDVMDTRNTDYSTGIGHLTSGSYDERSDPGLSGTGYLDAPGMPIPEPAVIAGPPPSRSAEMSLHPNDLAQPSRAQSRASQRSRTPAPHHTPTPSEALTARLRSPLHSEPLLRPPPNVAKRTTASRRISSAPSVMSQVFRFDKFFRDLKSLPWFSTRITVDYVPGEGRRSQRKTQKTLKSPGSWYTHPRHSLDLLSSGTTASAGSAGSPYSHRGHLRSTSPSLSSGYPSLTNHRGPRRRTHSQDAFRRYGRGYPMYPSAFPPYPFGYSPQPLFVMQPPSSQVHSPPAPPQTANSQPTPVFPELCQAVPVYMVPPSSPPVTKPTHERKHSKKSSRDHRHPEVHPYPLSMPGHPPQTTS